MSRGNKAGGASTSGVGRASALRPRGPLVADWLQVRRLERNRSLTKGEPATIARRDANHRNLRKTTRGVKKVPNMKNWRMRPGG